MRSALVGVIGHVDHGKTTLVKALTGADTDRLPEEKARGMSIVPGFALLRTPEAEIDLIDMPGHERFIRAMISGATGINAVLLVVAANEGIKPQTREHLEIARLIGIRRGVVAITKCDLVSPEAKSEVVEQVDFLVRELGFSMACVETSAPARNGLVQLVANLDALAEDESRKSDDGFFYLPIDRAFVRPGVGPVVTGTLRRGALKIGDEVELVPGGRRVRVRSLQTHGRDLQEAVPGRRTAVGLRGVEISDLHRGFALATPGFLMPSETIDVALSAVTSGSRRIVNGQRVRLLFGTSDVGARVRLLDCEEVIPGGTGLAQLRCDEPIAAAAREPFVLRLDSPSQTFGGGVVLDPASKRSRRFDAAAIERLNTLATRDALRIVRGELTRAGARGVSAARLAQLVALGPGRLPPLLDQVDARPRGGDVLVASDVWRGLAQRFVAALEAFHKRQPLEPGLRKDALTTSGEAPASVREALIAELVHRRELVNDGGFFRLASFHPRASDASSTALTSAIEAAFRNAGLSPPDEKLVTTTSALREQALRYLVRSGILVRARDRVQQRTITFHRDAIEQAKRTLSGTFADSAGFSAGEAGAALGTTRKFTIPLLEYLDAAGFTQRVADRRVIAGMQEPLAHADGEPRNRNEVEASSLRR